MVPKNSFASDFITRATRGFAEAEPGPLFRLPQAARPITSRRRMSAEPKENADFMGDRGISGVPRHWRRAIVCNNLIGTALFRAEAIEAGRERAPQPVHAVDQVRL